jgi:hypothetical protein
MYGTFFFVHMLRHEIRTSDGCASSLHGTMRQHNLKPVFYSFFLCSLLWLRINISAVNMSTANKYKKKRDKSAKTH